MQVQAIACPQIASFLANADNLQPVPPLSRYRYALIYESVSVRLDSQNAVNHLHTGATAAHCAFGEQETKEPRHSHRPRRSWGKVGGVPSNLSSSLRHHSARASRPLRQPNHEPTALSRY
jgi:hypothetical protein